MRQFNNHLVAFKSLNFFRWVVNALSGIWMSIFAAAISLLFCLTASSVDKLLLVEKDRPGSGNATVKKIGDYRKDLKTFLKRSKSKNETALFGATIDLCLLHDQIVNDARYESNDQLVGFRAIASDRLKKCKKEIELRLLRYRRANAGALSEESASTELDVKQTGLAELNFQPYEEFMAADMQAMTSLSGGPINLWNYTGNPAGPLCDYGPDLVNLIENTIDPESWRRNGGEGIIEYYQPLRIIVVGASSQVHDEMTDLLRTLRR